MSCGSKGRKLRQPLRLHYYLSSIGSDYPKKQRVKSVSMTLVNFNKILIKINPNNETKNLESLNENRKTTSYDIVKTRTTATSSDFTKPRNEL